MKRLLIVAQADFGRLVDPYQYARHLADEYEVTYLCWDYRTERIPEEGVRIIWVPRTGGMVRRLLRLLLRARREIRTGRYDLVFVVYFPACSLLLPRSRRTPMVMDVRTGYVRGEGLLRWLNNTLLRLESTRYRHVTVISESLRQELGLSPTRSHLLPLGAEPMDLPAKTFEGLRLLYVGTLQHRHIERTVEGLALARRSLGGDVAVTYDIVGSGPEEVRRTLLSTIERTGQSGVVKFHGYVQHRALRPFLERSNAGVAFIPITRFFDPQPSTKVIEYLLAGMPVVATATRENRGMVTEERGVLHADTAEGFAEGVRSLWIRRERYRSEVLRKSMLGSTWDAVVNDNLRPYLRSVIAKRDRRVPAETVSPGDQRPRVLIATPPMTDRGSTSILTVTQAFAEGLGDRYEFRTFYLTRRSGVTGGARFTPANLIHYIHHVLLWTVELARFRPAIAHFPVTSGWNIEKSLTMLALARFFGARAVGHLHGGSFDAAWGGMGKMRRWFAEREFHKLDRLIVLGTYWRTWTVSHLRAAPERVHVVNNPIDAVFERMARTFPLPGGPEVFFLGVVGKRKGVFDLLDAARLLQEGENDVSIVIAGPEDEPGEQSRVVERIRAGALGNVRLTGAVHGEAKQALFRDHGIFLFPSHNENFPLVILEAAAAGRAIITTRVGALPEFFEHGVSVIFVETGDPGAIAAAVRSLTADAERRRRLGEGARQVFTERLSRSRILAALEGVYGQALGTQGEQGLDHPRPGQQVAVQDNEA